MVRKDPLTSRRARRGAPRQAGALSGLGRPNTLRRALVFAASAALVLGLAAVPAFAAPGQGKPDSPGRSGNPGNPENPGNPGAPDQSGTDRAPQASMDVLVFHGPADQQNDPVVRATEAIEELGQKHGFTVDESTDPGVFTAENLEGYRSVVFLSAEGVTLNADQEAAFQDYVAEGGGFLGVHNAARAQADSDWFTGLLGTRPAGSGIIPEEVVQVEASGENPPNETKDKLVDGNDDTKWLTFEPTGWVTLELSEPTAINRYQLTSANDSPGRDPENWTLQGSQDGQSWTDLDTRTEQDFPDRFQTKDYRFADDQAYQHYRLDITANSGADLTQLAELSLFRTDATPPEETQPEVQEAVVSLVDRQHPANEGLPLTWTRSDRWINWDPNPVGEVHTVAQVKEKTYEPGEGANGPFHPISWCRDYDGGRSFYTGMGATEASYSEQKFRSHLLGAIQWTAGTVRGDCQATIASNYRVERLSGENAPGELDQHGETHGMDIASDGTVFYVGKAACPSGPVPDWENPDVGLGCGTIHQWDPESEEVTLLTTLDVFGNRGSGGELVKSENGLVGITLDPEFMDNGWIYVFWMPHDSIDRDKHIGKRTVSRLTYDFEKEAIDKSSRMDIMQWDAQIHSCCHVGGGMDFDAAGNLYIGSGDNNSSQGSDGYSGNNWTKDYKGVSFQDARRTAGNTNDLNGKIVRVKPLPVPDGESPTPGIGSTYTIPEGNLFPPDEYSGEKTRPEIYVMGVRNISTLSIDAEEDWLKAAWVGPDAFEPSPKLGPAKYETASIITSAGNQGWPYCMGNNQPYRDRSNDDASVLTNWYDCDDLKNTSPRNTGLVDIPDARENMIWYSPGGGGPVFPDREDSDVPTYEQDDATYTQPYLTGGCQAIMSGPTYHASQVDGGSGVAWPSYWEDKWFIGDECNAKNRVAVTLGPDSVEKQDPPAFAESLRRIIPAGGGDNELQNWMMDSKFGPDGALYMLDYGGGFFSLTDNQKLIRITYDGGPPTPRPSASATTVQGTPLTIAFTGENSGGVSYQWEFGDGSTSSEANPTHTYDSLGTYTATLTVTYADGETATKKVEVDVGCDVPDDRSSVWFRDTDTGVSNHKVGNDCTINDLIYDERDWSNHGAFVSHVDDVTTQLRDDGVISGREKGKLSSAAGKSDIGKKGNSGYEHIFDGTASSLDGWSQAPSGSFELRSDGSLRSSGGLGMLWYSARQFEDFSLKLRFRDVAPDGYRANSGVFVRFPDPTTPLEERPECGTTGPARNSQAWVAIYCGQEVQIYDGESGEPQKTGSVYNFDPVDLDEAGVTPKGEWNSYEIRVVDQHYTIIRNGEVINEFDNTPGKESSRDGDPPTDLRQSDSGFVGLQNHSDNDLIEFRNIRVREL